MTTVMPALLPGAGPDEAPPAAPRPVGDLWSAVPSGHPEAPYSGTGNWPWSVASLGRTLAFEVLSRLRRGGHRVGPVVDCHRHDVVKILVTPWPDAFLDTAFVRVQSSRLWCPGASLECKALWLLPDGRRDGLTDAYELFDLVHRVRRAPHRAPSPQSGQRPPLPAGHLC
ncbi:MULTISPECIES: hypothetical protein [unclassified Streptomyces]|uniref:hypothetical protein n=1 Tax=unclassified Streptomyces TaxID=2593676 RepID=UPI00081F0102|nr:MULTISPECIES: hypothetical protein [unclassified Streptomyces]MYZ37911.1 hypothetical protein [Streptomyces sp. SID4917]SCF95097.1 hypothetical protein GA0115259_1054613 [Streptomyces sp. MnatMP-M17]